MTYDIAIVYVHACMNSCIISLLREAYVIVNTQGVILPNMSFI